MTPSGARSPAWTPPPGGNTTAYTYPQDPINAVDLNGDIWSWLKTAGAWWQKHADPVVRFGCNFSWGVVGDACTAYEVIDDVATGHLGEAVFDGLAGVIGRGASSSIEKKLGRAAAKPLSTRRDVKIVRRVVRYGFGVHYNPVVAVSHYYYYSRTRVARWRAWW